MKRVLALIVMGALIVAACSKANADYDPRAIEAKYGLTGAFIDDVSTEEGAVKATIVPMTWDDGRQVQLIIPHQRIDDEHEVFLRDGITITPLELSDKQIARRQFVESKPAVVERRAPAATHRNKRSWEKEVLIVGGSAAAGAGIGAVAGGKKGAAIGALSGGVAGLVYDLATRKK